MSVAVSADAIVVQSWIGEQPLLEGRLDPATGMTLEHIRDLLGDAIVALETLFDRGCGEANVALARQSLPQRITCHHIEGECRYGLGDQATDPRFVALNIAVPAIDGHIFGSAYINTSQSLPSICLVPCIWEEIVCWTVSATGTPFTEQVVHNLFACAFQKDARAREQIAPLVGYDVWQTPWS
jgi:hypothetical protein